MYQVSGKLVGIAPMLMNRFSEGEQAAFRSGATSKGGTDEARRTAALERAYRGPNGLYLPPWNFKKCLTQGSTKAGLRLRRQAVSALLMATVFVDGELLFGKADPDFIHECMGIVRSGSQKIATVVRRPALDIGWELPFRLNITDDTIPAEAVKTALETAGLYVGLGGWRPEFGRFLVVWDTEER